MAVLCVLYNNMCLPGSLKDELDWSLSLGVGCLAWLITMVGKMMKISSVVRGRGDSLLSVLVGTRLVLLDSEAWGALFEFLADKDLNTVVIMLGMSAEVTVFDVFSSSIHRGLFSAPCRFPSLLVHGNVNLFSVLDLVMSFWVGFFLLVVLLGMVFCEGTQCNTTNFE